jgi:hypothetical protein
MPLTDRMVRDLAQLSRSAETNILAGVIEARRAEALEQLLNAQQAEQVFRLQGRVKAYDDLLKDMRGGPQTVARSAGSRTP